MPPGGGIFRAKMRGTVPVADWAGIRNSPTGKDRASFAGERGVYRADFNRCRRKAAPTPEGCGQAPADRYLSTEIP